MKKHYGKNGSQLKKDWTGSHRMSYENIIILDDTKSKPSEADCTAGLKKLQDDFDAAETANTNKKASGKQKLKDLGLDDDEIKALMGA